MEQRLGLNMRKGAQSSFGKGVFDQEGAAGLDERFELASVGAAWCAYVCSHETKAGCRYIEYKLTYPLSSMLD